MLSSTIRRSSSFWAWPGPARTYVLLLWAVVYAPVFYYFSKSGFALSVIFALTICIGYISLLLRADLSAEDWGRFGHFGFWGMRAGAVGAGYMLFHSTPTMIGRYVIVFSFAVLYCICEAAARRQKQAIETASNQQQNTEGEADHGIHS